MQYRSVKGFTPLSQLGILFLFLAGGFILTAITQMIISSYMIPAGTPLDKMGDVLKKALVDPKNVQIARLLQISGTFFLLFVPVVLYSLVTNGKNKFWLGFNKYVNIYQIIIGFCIIFAANILAAPIEDLTKSIVAHSPSVDLLAKQLETAYNEQVMAMSKLESWPEFLIAIAIMAFFPALFEEVLFRAGFQNILYRWLKSPIIAIIITSLLFSLVHMSVYLFLSRMVLGLVLGLMYHKTKNIWVNIIAHFLNNAIAVSQLFWMNMSNKKIDISKLDPKIPWIWGIFALILLIIFFWLLNKVSAKNLTKIEAKEAELYAKGNTYDPFNQRTI